MSENRPDRPAAEQAPLKKLASAQDLRGKKSGTDASDKPRKGKKLWVTLVALIVVLGVAIGIVLAVRNMTPAAEEEADTTATSDYVSETVKIVDSTRDQVASITLTDAEGASFTVLNNNNYDAEGNKQALGEGEEAYALEGLEDFDLDQSKAETLIGYAASLTASKMVAESADDLSEYGLDAPRGSVTFSYKDGSNDTWLIGAQAPTSTGSYFMEKGKKTVFLLYGTAINNMLQSRNDLHVVQMPYTIDSTTIKDFVVETQGKDTVEVRYSLDDDQFSSYSLSSVRLVQPFYYSAHSDRTDEFFTNIAALTISGYAGELSELEDTGLEDGNARIRVTTTVEIADGEETKQETYVYRIGNYYSADQVYVQVDDTDAVYLTDTSNVSFLDNATPGYLVDQFAGLVNITKVDHISIQMGDETWDVDIEHVENDGKSTELFTFNGGAAEDKPFRTLYQELIGLMNSRINDDYDYDAEPYMTVTYTLNVEPYELVFEYLTYDNDYLVVRRDGLSLFMIKRDKIDSLAESLRAFDEVYGAK